MTKHSAVQTTSELSGFSGAAPSVGNLKFYMPLGGSTCQSTKYPDTRVIPGHGVLHPFTAWLWVAHNEKYGPYIQHRLACSNSLVKSVQEADLCYPTCAVYQSLASKSVQTSSDDAPESYDTLVKKVAYMPYVCFEVPSHKRASWKNCPRVCLQPEAASGISTDPAAQVGDRCSVEVPYLHGVMWPHDAYNPGIIPPWSFDFKRSRMLTFVGCRHRGGTHTDRVKVIRAIEQEASRINPAAPRSVFFPNLIHEPMPNGPYDKSQMNNWYGFGRTPEFYKEAWGSYAVANFSWQPHGDTSTRNAVYDSIMFGCIPVVDWRGAYFYRRLFKGLLWKNLALASVFVIIPQGKENDGKAILQQLAAIPAAEIDARRKRLRSIATQLQWGANTPNGNDALLTALSSLRSG